MKIQLRSYKNKTVWHKWFAWRPITIQEGPYGRRWLVWLETVVRRREWISMGDWWWDYKAKAEVKDE